VKALDPQRPDRKGKCREELRIGELMKMTTGLEKEGNHWRTRYEVAQAFVDLSQEAEQKEVGRKKKNGDVLRKKFIDFGLQAR
jgi:hypothetical protein